MHGIDQSWNRNAALWIAAVRGSHIPSRARVTNDAVFEAVMRGAPKRALDIGCGEGWLARRLSAHCAVTGFDVSPVLVSAAGEGEFHSLSYAEFCAAPARVGMGFDAAVANFSLFEEDLHPLLGAVYQVLGEGGRLIIQTLYPGTFAPGWHREEFTSLAALGDWQPMPWYCRTQAEWRALLAACGFDEIVFDEPRADADSPPSSLLITSRRASSRETETPAPRSTPA